LPATAFAFSGVKSALLVHPALATPVAAETEVTPAATVQLAATQPLAVVKSTNVATINPAMLRFQNPMFRPPIYVNQGQPRSAFSLPTLVSPTGTPDDSTLFEDPQDATKKFFLTTYAIAVTGGASSPGKWVTFAPAASGFLLTVHLTDTTPAAQTQGNGRLSPDTRYLITANLQSRVVSWDLSAAPAGADGSLSLTLAVADFAGRDLLYAAMTDPTAQAQLIIRRSLALALPITASANYASASQAIDSVIGFTFNKDLDAQVFAGLQGAAAAPLAPWKVVHLDWNGRAQTYYQSSSQPDQAYFLPDAFKVGRQAHAPHLPDLAVTAVGDSAADMAMTLSYLAVPVWDPKRIEAALPLLQQTLGLPQPPSLALFEASDTTLMLSLPGADPTAGSTLTAQSNVLIDLAAGVQGSVTMGLAAFRQVYDALFDARSPLLSGEVRVTVGSDTAALPFDARIADLAGDIFDTQVTIDSKSNTLTAALTNAIENTIHVAGLTGVITRNGTPIAATCVTSLSPAAPADLAPAGSGGDASKPADGLTVTLGLSAVQAITGALGGLFTDGGPGGLFGGNGGAKTGLGDVAGLVLDASCAPLFDFSQVTVTPDPAATWRAIMANGTPSPVSRTVNLKFLAASLTPPAAPPATPAPGAVLAIQVEFQGGQTANFDASQTADAAGFMNQAVKLNVPIEAFVLGDSPTDTYTYRVDAVTPSGIQQGAWTTDNLDVLYIVPH
jgi:hypothetical protein